MEKNVYATNRGGCIKAPKAPGGKDPSVSKTVATKGGDLRNGK